MGTKTIGLDEEAYERLKAEKRENESFSDVVKRVTAAVHTDWRRGFGKYTGEDGERLESVATGRRDSRAQGLAARRRSTVDVLDGDAADGERDNGKSPGSDES